jgi:aspartyl-tRNA(Asn)/glutamyl-tRNA(Gln) amidotransferase subunit C
MTKITRDEVLKIARMANIALYEHEIEPMIKKLDDVLTYAERVIEAARDGEESSQKQVNVLRPDQIITTDSVPLLAQAPEREENYFVVPKVLSNP